MQMNYEELMEEIQEITTVDGFIAACLEIKESMFFYERDLMLAAYSASLELLSVVTLLNGALKGKRELHRVEGELSKNLDRLLVELGKFSFPIDIQHVVDCYLQGNGLRTRTRLAIYSKMIQGYLVSLENREGDVTGLLGSAHRVLANGGPDLQEKLFQLLAQVGVRLLRGEQLRPIWLRVSHPAIAQALLGLQTLVNNLRVTSYVNYPLEDITTERQKRQKIKGNVVADLGVFRNFRQGGSGFTEMNLAFVRDQYDAFLESFLSNLDELQTEPDEEVKRMLKHILEARLVNDGIEPLFISRLLLYLERWSLIEFSDLLLEILAVLDSEDPLFYEFWTVLRAFDSKALPAMRRFARADRQSSFLPYLSLFLSYGTRSKRKWTLLTEIFENYPEENEVKAQIASSLGKYGGAEAVSYLENVVAASTNTEKTYREALEKALKRARARA